MAEKEKLKKVDIIDSLYNATMINRKDIHEIIDLVLQELRTAMLAGKTIELRGFGTFSIKRRKGRSSARNPKTGEIVSVQDHGVVSFKPGRELRAAAWELKQNP